MDEHRKKSHLTLDQFEQKFGKPDFGKADDLCQCSKCGRMHRHMGFGTPPDSISTHAPVADLVKALEKYGRHEPTCPKYWPVETQKCTCGFDTALAAAKGG